MNSREEFERFVRDDLGLTETDDLSGTTDNVKYVWDKVREFQAAALSEAVEALREAEKMAVAIEKDSLEPDKVYIHAGRIKQACHTVLAKYQEARP